MFSGPLQDVNVRYFFLLCLVTGVIGCSDDSSGPAANVAGSWTYNAPNIATSGFSCAISNATLTLNQSGTTFSGSYVGTITCNGQSDTGGGSVVNGRVTGTTVAFNFDNADWQQAGTIDGNSMGGTVTVRVTSGGVTTTLSGNWTAVRK